MEAFLGTFKSPGPVLLNLGLLSIRWYGLLIAIAVLIGLNLSTYLAKRNSVQSSLINDLMPGLVLISILGARVYYVIFEWRNYTGLNFWSSINFIGFRVPIPSAFEIWGGGIAIHGALISGTIFVLIFCKLRRQPFLSVLDVLIPSVVLGQAIGRWGNFFNNEAFGIPTNLPWKLYIPTIYRPEVFANQEFFHPTFLYESIWNLFIFIFLLVLLKRSEEGKFSLASGVISCIYLISYSLGRIWIEGLRVDPLCLGGLPPFCEGGIRMAQAISLLLFGIGSLGLYLISRTQKVFSKQSNAEWRGLE